jgi:hypothetical protein
LGDSEAFDALLINDEPDIEDEPEGLPVLPPGPVFVPGLKGEEIAGFYAELAGWVDGLRHRYQHLGAKVIPACWWRHQGHVEALQALRDAERALLAESAAPMAAANWQQLFAIIESRLREFAGEYGCGEEHTQRRVRQDTEAEGPVWDEFIEAQRQWQQDHRSRPGGGQR